MRVGNNVFSKFYKDPQELQRLIGLKYEQVQKFLNKAIKLHNQKRELAEYKKSENFVRGERKV